MMKALTVEEARWKLERVIEGDFAGFAGAVDALIRAVRAEMPCYGYVVCPPGSVLTEETIWAALGEIVCPSCKAREG